LLLLPFGGLDQCSIKVQQDLLVAGSEPVVRLDGLDDCGGRASLLDEAGA
jgi:hypothetical protein